MAEPREVADRRMELLADAGAALEAGDTDCALARLHEALEVFDEPDRLTFGAFRGLGQATRLRGDLEAARHWYNEAARTAVSLEDDALLSAAVAGLAFTEEADDHPRRALALFDEAARLALAAKDDDGYAAVLNAKANLLTELGRPAGRLFEQALAREGLSPRSRAILEDNFGHALEREGRHDKAFEHRRRAASFFRQAGLRYDLFKTLLNLSAHFARLGRQADLERAFEEAHDVIHRLSAEQVDVNHYRQFESRAQEAAGDESPELERGQALLDLGRRYLGAGQYGAAERSLLEARANLEDAGAVHCLIQVDVALGDLYTNAGQCDEASVRLRSARDLAHGIGDAWFECLALLNLSRLDGELDPLELIARAGALRAVAIQQALPAEMQDDSYMRAMAPDRGVLESRELDICLERGALRLAQRYCQQAVDLAEGLRDPQRYRLAFRLVKLVEILDRRGRSAQADAVMERLRRLCAEHDDPRIHAATKQADGRRRLQKGARGPETLALLLDACDAYERIWLEVAEVGEPDDYGSLMPPPYDDAVDVALHNGRTELAFDLLERSRARSLVEALRGRLPRAGPGASAVAHEEQRIWAQLQRARAEFHAAEAAASPTDRARRLHQASEQIQDLYERLDVLWRQLALVEPGRVAQRLAQAVSATELLATLNARDDPHAVVELFVGARQVIAFVFDSSREDLRVVPVRVTDDERWADLVRRAGEATADDPGGEIADLLAHPAMTRISEFLHEAAAHETLVVVPHGLLHGLPIHLQAKRDGQIEPRPGTHYLPTASLLRTRRTRSDGDGRIIVAGDPLGDLDFARVECADLGRRYQVEPTTGAEVTLDWLAACLRDDGQARFVHLACHAAFDARRPERSGLELAPVNGAVAERPGYLPETSRTPLVDRATLSELLQIDWHGALVVVSACSSGRYRVGAGNEFAGLPRTLLARGAQALLMSLWEVDDMATAVLMSKFYDAWERHGGEPEHAGLALSEAQRGIRDMTAAELVSFGCAVGREAIETQDPRLLRAARRAISGGHQAAGNFEQAELWRPAEAATGDPVWEEAFAARLDGQSRSAGAPEYAAAPFADPIYWAAFVVFGA